MTLLFDLDGTLTDPAPGITACIRHAMLAIGDPLHPDKDLRFCIGPPLQESFAQLLGSEDRVAEAMGHYRTRFKALGMYENEVYAGVVDALERLVERGPLYVVTSKPRVFAVEIVRHFGLEPYFRKVYGSELDGRRSDKGELIGYVLDEEGLDPAETWMIGDREHDMIGAGKNGVRGVGVAWGYGSREELVAAGALHVLGETKELVTHVW